MSSISSYFLRTVKEDRQVAELKIFHFAGNEISYKHRHVIIVEVCLDVF